MEVCVVNSFLVRVVLIAGVLSGGPAWAGKDSAKETPKERAKEVLPPPPPPLEPAAREDATAEEDAHARKKPAAKEDEEPQRRTWLNQFIDISAPVLPAPRTAVAGLAWGAFGLMMGTLGGALLVALPSILVTTLSYSTLVGAGMFLFGLLMGGVKGGFQMGMTGLGVGILFGLFLSVPVAVVGTYASAVLGAAALGIIGMMVDGFARVKESE
jgi:hypothetical protein